MRVAVLVLGILIVLEGILLVVKPEIYSKVAGYFAKGKLMRIVSLVKIAFGVFLLIAATSCDRKWIVIVLGLIYAGAGVIMFGVEKEKLKKMFQWWAIRPKIIVRFLGILAAALGGLIIYAAGMPK